MVYRRLELELDPLVTREEQGDVEANIVEHQACCNEGAD